MAWGSRVNDTEAMEESIYIDDARMWLADYVDKTRQENKVFIAINLCVAIASLLVAYWFMGFFGTLSFVVILVVAYLVMGGFKITRPAINAQSIQPRLLGVSRYQRLAWWGPEQIRRELEVLVGLLMAPVHLTTEAVRLHRTRKALLDMDEESVAHVLALICERDGAWRVDELVERLGAPSVDSALAGLLDIEPVIWLADPNRISLAPSAIRAIRGEAA